MSFNTATSAININGTRVATTSPVAVNASDNVVITKLTTPGAVAVNLEASPTQGRLHVIKDGKGDAATNNVTITPAAGTIDGQPNLVMANAYESITLVYSGTEWVIV